MCKAQPIGNLLYTKEDAESEEKAKAELKVPDPKPEKAYGVLTDAKQHEQKTS